jgi:glycine/D-amino acid oxidase-like deaminating enzyme
VTRSADPLAGASSTPLWLDSPDAPHARPSFDRDASCDLAVVGGGYAGLWTAVLAKEANPARTVVLLEAESIAWAASGRNGGFCDASLTHGTANGINRFPDEYEELERLGRQNLHELVDTVERYAIRCDLEPTGSLMVATEAYQIAHLQCEAERGGGRFLDTDEVRSQVASPTYLAGLWSSDTVLVHPAKLAWGLADAAESLGVTIYEHSRVTGLRRSGDGVELATRTGTITARQAGVCTNAFPSLVRRVRPFIVPVYDYALATEPLSRDQRAAIGWRNRQGIGDSANQFHYYRQTADDRIVFGGYDAIYHFRRKLTPALDQRQATFELLARHFYETFPQLEGVRFSHAWGGAIDLCSRFCAFFGTSLGGRVAYSAGYTGLGVGATRFGAAVILDLLAGVETERTRTAMVRSTPIPFPPEPFTWLGVTATRAALKAADRNEGRRNLWLRTLDRVGLGFDS